MTLLNPLAWYFLALLPILVALYLFRPRRAEVRVSTLLFWNRVAGAAAQQSWFQKLRRFWSLLFSLLLFALLLLALGRINFQLGSGRGGVDAIVLAVDTTWSLRAQAAGSDSATVLDQARASAEAILNRLPRGAEAALIGVSERPEVLCGITPQISQVREALQNRLNAVNRDGNLRGSLDLARLLARESGARDRVKIYLLTDRTAEAEALVKDLPGPSVEVVPLRPKPGNTGITGFAVRPQPNDRQTVQAFLRIQNFGSQPALGEAQLTVDGRLIEALPLELAPGGELRREISFMRPAQALNYKGQVSLTLRLQSPDALATDNAVYAILPAPRVRRVLLVTESNWFLEKVLAADPAMSYEQLAPDAFTPAIGAGFDLVVLDRLAPPLAEGTFPRLYIGSTPEELRGAQGEIATPVVTSQEPVSGFSAGLGLERVLIRAALPLKPAGELPPDWTWEPLLLSVTDPLVLLGRPLESDSGRARTAVMPFDLLQSDLPLRVGFPVLMHDLLDWLAADSSTARAAETRNLRLGDADLPAGAQPGFRGSPETGFVAVNALDAGESALEEDAVASPGPALGAVSLPDPRIGPPVWVYLALLAAVLVTGESFYLWRHART